MKRIRIFFKNFFGFSRTESNAAVILILITLLVAILPRIYLRLAANRETTPTDSLSLLTWHEEVLESLKPKDTPTERRTTTTKVAERFPFDPNTIDSKGLQRLGFRSYVADRIVKYRDAGGKFSSQKDLLRIYGIDSALVKQLRPYIRIPQPESAQVGDISENERVESLIEANAVEVTEEKPVSMDLNSATALELQQIRGIGPYYSERVVKYRQILGGYHTLQQLSEVYGLKPEAVDLLKKHTFIGEGPDKNILINTDSIQLLAKHPYLSTNQARAIVNYRRQHGTYQQLDDILSVKIIDDSLYLRLLPYLSLDK